MMLLIKKGKRDLYICSTHKITHGQKRCPKCKAAWIREENKYRRMAELSLVGKTARRKYASDVRRAGLDFMQTVRQAKVALAQ